jgi:hypothetical protein
VTVAKLSKGVEWLLKQQMIRPSEKLVSETILPAAIETEESGDRVIVVERKARRINHE